LFVEGKVMAENCELHKSEDMALKIFGIEGSRTGSELAVRHSSNAVTLHTVAYRDTTDTSWHDSSFQNARDHAAYCVPESPIRDAATVHEEAVHDSDTARKDASSSSIGKCDGCDGSRTKNMTVEQGFDESSSFMIHSSFGHHDGVMGCTL
jgi:hypothetical protein